ncbi:replicative DNA helicase [Bacteroides sp. 519]|uniref:replicative DNA helicase n=1 Tax=Bacteroides sp. 519 TaxID=2302937 RepID=UPI0013D59A54|nr:replicative DNA helicase [Bacteroides sp. 519]NDV58071.1 replicative DNA helicase [Bacteroides sp. 519]
MKKTQKTLTPLFGSVTPQALDAERAVIGAIIGFGSAIDEVLFLTPNMFYDSRHRVLFEAIMALKQKNAAIDLITVSQEILVMGQGEQVMPWFIAELTGSVTSHAHIVDHALIVKQKYLQRQVVEFSLQVQSKAGTESEDIADVLTGAGKEIEHLQEVLVGQEEEASYREISAEFYEDINIRMNRFNNKLQTGITTGLTELNQITSGWQGSELVILAARPAMGKTAVALHLAQSAAHAGTSVLIFSLEMSRVSLYKRSILSESDDINPGKLKSGDLLNELKDIDKSVAKLSKLPIYVDDNANINMAYIRSKSRLLNKRNKCDMVIIDYLQLITAEKGKYGNREQEIASMSREAKLIAKELDIPVILLSQLNRDVERRQDKRPMLSDLRESGAIEQDADMVVFIHRPGYYGKATKDKNGNEVKNAGELIIAKYRNGPIGRVKFRHNDTLTKIEDF